MAEAEPVYTGQETAVIGLSVRLNRATTSEEFWDKLKNGVELISFYTEEELIAAGQNPGLVRKPGYVKAGLILEDKEYFDTAFFGYTPREAELLDPQVRIFHECSWQALEDAGIDPGEYTGLIGVYAGAVQNLEWEARVLISGKGSSFGSFAASRLTGIRYLCTRLSYNLNLKGPSISMQTSCSTSLVAIHLACQALLSGECDVAIAGGVTASAREKNGYIYEENLIVSPDGHNRTFDARAGGTIFGEGAGVVILKPLEDALAENDNIYAIIRGSAVNNDGSRKVGFTAPSVEAQVEMMRAAYHLAGIEPGTIGLVEAHGTATQLGDPIEVEALKQAFDTGTGKKGHCWLGSVKTNVGHLDAAAGVVGFIKAVLAIKNRQIPPGLYFEIPNPELNLIDSPFVINTVLTPWEREDSPLRAAVNSLGMGGTNAHVVLEEAPAREESSKSRQYQLILLSARTRPSLDAAKKNLADFLKKNRDINLADVAYTLQTRRKTHPYRAALVCSRVEEAIQVLSGLNNGKILENDPANGDKKIETGIEENIPEPDLLLERIGKPWLYGEKIDWTSFYAEEKRHCISLPAYAFDRQRYWIEDIPMETLGTGRGAAKRENLSEWFYTVSWSRTAQLELKHNQKKNRDQYNWLLFLDDSPMQIGTQLQKRLEPHSRCIITVEMGDGWSKQEKGRYIISPGEKAHYDQLLTALEESGQLPQKIVHLWGITGNGTAVSIEEGQNRGFYSLIYLAQAISRYSSDNGIEIIVVTDHMQKVTGTETTSPIKSTVLGPVYVIPQEHINIGSRSIDISLSKADRPEMERLAEQLILDFLDANPEKITAYRNGHKWKQAFERIKLAEGSLEKALKEKGVYLITGGLGRLGLRLAGEFAGTHRCKLALIGRRRLPDRQQWQQWQDAHGKQDVIRQHIDKIRELEETGSQVLYFSADVSDFETMQTVVHRVEEKFGTINGIIHAAGGTRGESIGLIRSLDRRQCQHQFKSKIDGLVNLDRLFRDKEPDFFILTSSMTSYLGGWEYAAYTAANFYLDSFVRETGRWISINLDPLNLEGDKDAQTTINNQELTGVIKTILNNIRTGQILTSISDIQERIEKAARPLEKGEGEARHNREKKNAVFFPRPRLSTPYVPPRDEIEEVIVEICRQLFGYEKIGIMDNFFELGGNSLTVIRFVSDIHKKFETKIQIHDVFEKANLHQLAAYIKKAEKKTFSAIQPVEKKEYYGLSSAQKRLYIVQQMENDTIEYNLFGLLELEGLPDKEWLEETFRGIIRRHESLRTSFHLVEGTPVQKIHEEVEFEIVEETAAEDTQVNEKIKKFIRPFDLAGAPLLRAAVITIKKQKHLLIRDVHHIISDAISMDILTREYMALYEGKELPGLKLQYKDYNEWQSRYINSPGIKNQETYWLKQFAGEFPVINLPYDHERPAHHIYRGELVFGEIGAEESARLREIAARNDASLSMLLLTLYYVLLSKYTDQDDIVVGLPVSGRFHHDLHHIIGMFVNTLAIRNYPTYKKRFTLLLREVKERFIEALDNQGYQFDTLVERLKLKRNPNRNPLFDVLFHYINPETPGEPGQEPGEIEIENSLITPYSSEGNLEPSRFDLILNAVEFEKKISYQFLYRTSLFKKSTIEKMSSAFKRLIDRVIQHPDREIYKIEIVQPHGTDSEEKNQNQTAAGDMEIKFNI